MKVCVVGGAGYIGAHTCKAVAQAGHDPVVYDNLSTGHECFVKWGPLEMGDIRDGDRLREVLRAYRPDVVMHFAALAYVEESVQDPDQYYDINVGGSRTLLSAMLQEGVEHIVFSSTCATYGLPKTVPIEETFPQSPINPYGFTKLVVENMLRDFSAAYDLNYAALRYFNAAGADAEGEVGELHDPETHVIPLAIDAALGRRESFNVYGDDYPTADGSAVRDFVHVTDLAGAHVKAAEYLIGGGDSLALNLATGVGTSVFDLSTAIRRVTGHEVPLVHAPRRAGDPPELFASGAKAREVLGWEPTHSDINNIILTALNWALSNKEWCHAAE